MENDRASHHASRGDALSRLASPEIAGRTATGRRDKKSRGFPQGVPRAFSGLRLAGTDHSRQAAEPHAALQGHAGRARGLGTDPEEEIGGEDRGGEGRSLPSMSGKTRKARHSMPARIAPVSVSLSLSPRWPIPVSYPCRPVGFRMVSPEFRERSMVREKVSFAPSLCLCRNVPDN